MIAPVIFGTALHEWLEQVGVLAQFNQRTESIIARRHFDHHGSYRFTVTITGGRYSGIEFHCRTEQSTLWLFDRVVAHRKNNTDWNWLW
jgi:hypothetical protein